MVHGILLARVPFSDVDDLLQDVFLEALPRLADLREVSRFPGWLASITRNRATDFHRRRKPTDEFDEQSPAVQTEAPAPATPHSSHSTAEAHAVLDAIRTLPDAYREPLILRLVEGMTGPEIAARTGLTHGSVRVNLHRGMQQLREILDRKAMPEEIPAAILFERRGAQLGYRMLGPLRDQVSYALPELSSSLDSLSTSLESILVSQGLFPDEAHAMLETWRNSWFEEGSRLIYILPRRFIDSVLPLRVTPAPATTTRVFVGRLEIVTPATERAVESALASNDQLTLAKYNRFLEPILRSMVQKSTDSVRREQLEHYFEEVSASLYTNSKN